MTTEDKLLLALLGGGVLYLIMTTRFPSKQPISVHVDADSVRTSERVMGYAEDMLRFGLEQGVDPALIAAVITVESSGMADAAGAAGEIGLMQILPSTAQWIGRVSAEQLRTPATNIQVGTAYIRYCVDRKGGNVAAGIAGYNYGPDRVRVQGDQVVAPEGVLRHVAKVLNLVEPYRARFSATMGNAYMRRFGDGRLILSGLKCGACHRLR